MRVECVKCWKAVNLKRERHRFGIEGRNEPPLETRAVKSYTRYALVTALLPQPYGPLPIFLALLRTPNPALLHRTRIAHAHTPRGSPLS